MAITVQANLDSAGVEAYELGARFALRDELVFSSIRKVKPAPVTHNSDTYSFWFYDEITPSTTALTENVDVTPDAIGDSKVTVTIAEYGQAAGRTRWVKATGMLDYDPALANLVGRASGVAYDTLARNALVANTTNIRYGGDATSTVTLTTTDYLTAALVRRSVADLVTSNAAPYMGDKYLAIVHPYQSLDLREETGDAAWLASQIRQDHVALQGRAIGSFAGATFVENNRVLTATDGATSETVYRGLFLGEEALACAFASNVCGEMPGIEVSPVIDKLNRFVHIGWYWVGGFARLREEAIQRVETAASLT